MHRNSAAIIGVCIVLGFLILGLMDHAGPGGWHGGASTDGEVGRYQFLRANDVTLAVLDTRTGRVWMKFIGSNEGPAKWSEDSPDLAPPALQQKAAPPAPPAPPKQ